MLWRLNRSENTIKDLSCGAYLLTIHPNKNEKLVLYYVQGMNLELISAKFVHRAMLEQQLHMDHFFWKVHFSFVACQALLVYFFYFFHFNRMIFTVTLCRCRSPRSDNQIWRQQKPVYWSSEEEIQEHPRRPSEKGQGTVPDRCRGRFWPRPPVAEKARGHREVSGSSSSMKGVHAMLLLMNFAWRMTLLRMTITIDGLLKVHESCFDDELGVCIGYVLSKPLSLFISLIQC